MPQAVLVTGAAGFVGSAVVRQLLAAGLPTTALARTKNPPPHPALRIIVGDLLDPAALDRAMQDCVAVIHLVGIIKEIPAQSVTFQRIHVEGTQAVLAAATRNGVRRYIHMSALGVRPNAACDYHRTKYAAEQLVQAAGLDWTIFRPSLIHGPGGEFMTIETGWAQASVPPYLFMPYFGPGLTGRGPAGRIQPVYVEDVARAFVQAIDNPRAVGRAYPLGGAEAFSWPIMHRFVARAVVGRPRPVIPIPVWYARLLTLLAPASWLPFNRDQIAMSQEDNTCDMTDFIRDFGWPPLGFAPSALSYLSH